MTEYIDKAKLIKECNFTVCWEEDGDEEEAFGISEATIDLMPTIDIVRCGECKYHDNNDDSPKWLPCMVIETPKDWFCKDGER